MMQDLSGKTIRGYELRQRIGAGGFGAVYTAHQQLVGREVAIKVILPQYANHPEFIRRFELEAQLVARLEHPFIVPLYDFWREPNSAYLVMRLIRGGSLATLLHHAPLPLETCARLVDQIAMALSVAHRAGVVHRDLKPANILLDTDGNAYLCDFGIAKDLQSSNGHNPEDDILQPETGLVGSPAYLSPEQVGNANISARSDIYALGFLIYQMLVGEHPYPSDITILQLLQMQLRDAVPSIYEKRPDLPSGLDDIVQHATAKNPEDRYADVLELSADLWRVATGVHLAMTPIPISLQDTLEIASHQTLMVDPLPKQNPYKGLRPFEEADADDFFGRTVLVERLLESLQERRFLAIVGPSGSGKSSVVKAGLLPALRRGKLPDSDHWFISEMLSGPNPLDELRSALLSVATNVPDTLLTLLETDDEGLAKAVEAILPDDGVTQLVLVIDQFEELFTQVESEGVRTHVLKLITKAVSDRRSRLRVIITIRADFYDRPLLYSGFGDLVRQSTEVVLPMTHDELEQAIVGPPARLGIKLDKRLVSAIIHEVGEQPGALPLLQYALTDLFERGNTSTLTFSHYHITGGVTGALARRAEELYEGLAPAAQTAARHLFLRLVSVSENTDDTRRRVLWDEVVSLKARHPEVEAVIDLYGKYRLLTFDVDPINRVPTVEVAHEALLRQWERLREWLEDNREDIHHHRRLIAAAHEWMNNNRDSSYLLTGNRLSQFNDWASTADLALTQIEADYLHASLTQWQMQAAAEAAHRQRVEALERRSRRVLKGLVVVSLLAAVGALLLTLVAFNQRHEAQDARQQAESNAHAAMLYAERAESSATQAQQNAQRAETNAAEARSLTLATGAQLALADDNTDLAILLALEANQSQKAPPLAQRSLFEAAYAPGTRLILEGHSDWLRAVALSPIAPLGVTASQDNTLVLWNMETGQLIRRLEGHLGAVTSVKFSHDGLSIFSGSCGAVNRVGQCIGGEVIRWDASSGAILQRYQGHTNIILGLDISSDDRLLATGSDDTNVIIWDVASGAIRHTLTRHNLRVWDVAFTPDGERLVTVSEDANAIVWEVESGTERLRFEYHTGPIYSVDISPSGRWVVTGGASDNSLYIWAIDTGLLRSQLIGHADAVYDAIFSPDGSRILSGSHDTTLREWDVARGIELKRLTGHHAAIRGVAYSPLNHRALSGAWDNTARYWDLDNGAEILRLVGHSAPVYAAAISYNGQQALSAAWDNTLILWDLQTGQLIRRLEGHGDWVRDVAFGPFDDTAVSASYDGTLILWDLASGDIIHRLRGHTSRVWAVDYSRDGYYIVSGSQDGTARVWNPDTGQEVLRFGNHNGWVRGVDISPDGRTVLSVSGGDNTLRWWDIETGAELAVFQGHSDWLWSVAFSPDGRMAATSAADSTIILWDLSTQTMLRRYEGHTGPVHKVAFSPFGQRILSASADGTVRLWDVESGAEVRRYVGHTAGVWGAVYSPLNDRVLSAAGDGTLILWRISDLFELHQWIEDNRYIRELTCYEREQFRIEPLCEAGAAQP